MLRTQAPAPDIITSHVTQQSLISRPFLPRSKSFLGSLASLHHQAVRLTFAARLHQRLRHSALLSGTHPLLGGTLDHRGWTHAQAGHTARSILVRQVPNHVRAHSHAQASHGQLLRLLEHCVVRIHSLRVLVSGKGRHFASNHSHATDHGGVLSGCCRAVRVRGGKPLVLLLDLGLESG